MSAALLSMFKSFSLTYKNTSIITTILNVNQVVNTQALPSMVQCVRTKMVRRIRGGGRPVPPGVIPPEPNKYKFRVIYPEDGKYTTRALTTIKMGGRHPITGRVVVETLGGGSKQKYRWIKSHLYPGLNNPVQEKIQFVRYCPIRSADIAFAQTGEDSRWITASENMKKGDIITTYSDIPRIPVRPKEGDSHPIGALPTATTVFNIETLPGMGGRLCKAAGTSATFTRRLPNGQCILQLPSKREISIDEKCMVTVGRVSNIEFGKEHIGSARRLRWLGHRPRSGLWHRKDGYCGRKIKPPKAMMVYSPNRVPKPEPYILNL